MTAVCAANPKTCFGSCPTFYVSDGKHAMLQAEGFSSSIAPSLEARDVDALYRVHPSGREFIVTMKNEALETHFVRRVRLLAAKRPVGGRVLATGPSVENALRCRSYHHRPACARLAASQKQAGHRIGVMAIQEGPLERDLLNVGIRAEVLGAGRVNRGVRALRYFRAFGPDVVRPQPHVAALRDPVEDGHARASGEFSLGTTIANYDRLYRRAIFE
jgi:hypothetical protein